MSIGFVRYHSPFGTPEWLLRAVAERRLAADLRVYERELDAGGLTRRQLEHGPPYIDDDPRSTRRTLGAAALRPASSRPA
jgi:hypothetical protein